MFKSKERRTFNESLKDQEFRKSYIQNSIEEIFQSYLKMDLEEALKFKRKLRDAQDKNDKDGIKEASLQVQFFSGEISELKAIKKDLQRKGAYVWNHTDFSDEGITELKEKISDSFSYAASTALRRIG